MSAAATHRAVCAYSFSEIHDGEVSEPCDCGDFREFGDLGAWDHETICKDCFVPPEAHRHDAVKGLCPECIALAEAEE